MHKSKRAPRSAPQTAQKKSGGFTVEMWDPADLIPYARNPRDNELSVSKVAASITEFGWRQPIVVDEERVILAGHTRHRAALQLGLKEVPVHVAAGLTPQQAKAYRLMDNRSGEDSKWVEDMLKLELGELKDFSFDLSLTGFDAGQLATFEGGSLLSPITPNPNDADEPARAGINVLTFGRKRVPITDAEYESLCEQLAAWEAEVGTPYGFVANLLGSSLTASDV